MVPSDKNGIWEILSEVSASFWRRRIRPDAIGGYASPAWRGAAPHPLQSSLEALAYSNQSHLIEGIGKLPGGLPKPLGCILMPLLTSIRLSSDQISRCVEWAEILDLLQLV
jgi:hypothetical protein